MTTSQIIACAISVTAAIVSITALVLTVRARREPVRWDRQPVRWGIDDCVITFDRKLTAEEFEEFRAEWLRRYGSVKPGTPPSGPAGASSANTKRGNEEASGA